MDGTLTRHRQKINTGMCRRLISILKNNRVGILSGAKFKDICDQCGLLWDEVWAINLSNLYLLPCNGTQLYAWENTNWKLHYKSDMAGSIGHENFQILLRQITLAQMLYTNDEDYLGDFYLTHDFIDYRESLLNWCPIGRSSSKKIRSKFVDLDTKKDARSEMRKTLKALLSRKGFDTSKVEIAKGGQTSLDIFPKGWNKTYSLKHFNASECWFVGDACEKGQNDYEIYEMLQKEKRSFKTQSPKETLTIIDNLLDFS